jgi:secreted PhoX family phosphatase
LVLDPQTLQVVSSNMVLTGTLRNCGGGACPWGFISCEETTDPGHGYSFLCHADDTSLQKPRIIKQYGRFRHESVAFDPRSGRAYLTEDEEDGCLYRFTPRSIKKPFSGKLEVTRVKERPKILTRSQCRLGEALEVDWVPIEDPDARTRPTRIQAQEQGGALFARGEGAWMDGSGVVFTATVGGLAGRGQVFRLSFSDELTLVAESESDEHFNGPDNITVAPWGDFIVAEDGPGPQHLFGITRDGACYPILRNQKSNSELAGVCFSPDGSVLFCNVQWDGLTVAVRGPFRELFAPS